MLSDTPCLGIQNQNVGSSCLCGLRGPEWSLGAPIFPELEGCKPALPVSSTCWEDLRGTVLDFVSPLLTRYAFGDEEAYIGGCQNYGPFLGP